MLQPPAKAPCTAGEPGMTCVRRLLMAALAGILASSCVRDEPVPLSPAATAAALESRSLSDPRLRQFVLAATRSGASPDASIRWNLSNLTAAALYYHPDIALAEAKLAAAEAAVITARPDPQSGAQFHEYRRAGGSCREPFRSAPRR